MLELLGCYRLARPGHHPRLHLGTATSRLLDPTLCLLVLEKEKLAVSAKTGTCISRLNSEHHPASILNHSPQQGTFWETTGPISPRLRMQHFHASPSAFLITCLRELRISLHVVAPFRLSPNSHRRKPAKEGGSRKIPTGLGGRSPALNFFLYSLGHSSHGPSTLRETGGADMRIEPLSSDVHPRGRN